MATLYAGVDAWMIQEGNLPEFSVGQCVRLGLMFAPRHVEPSPRPERKMVHLGGCCYHLRGRVRFGDVDAWSLDVGWRLRGDGRPAGLIETLDWLQGEGALQVDPWCLAMPPRPVAAGVAPVYFTVRQIVRDTAFHHHLHLSENRSIHPGRRAQSLVDFIAEHHDDASQHRVAATNAWTDDLGNAHYVLALEPAMLTSEATVGGAP